ncbi:MAG: hypothetical protein XE03_1497 [candidate division TA06 bacterium 34_109]|uniref:Carboxypeptidase regulatory-like domain-containing protein n=1 Tax=candidate division TA06 bacterium 34_109 TaxID=1635277 RepID=A0A124G051_UNCT6|nr:MAG: hypothetical protein XE03_1497 [candidate division TA06 bacterium 34_109]
MVRKFFSFFILLFLFFSSCYIDVPHNGLLDPENRFGKSTVKIECYDRSHNPLAGVLVTINDTITKVSDDFGCVSFLNLLKGNLRVKFFKDGYSTLYIDTILFSGVPLNLVEYLNFIPKVETSYVYSSVRKTYDIFDSLRFDVNFVIKVLEKDSIEDISEALVYFDFGRFELIKVNDEDFIKCSLNFNKSNSPMNLYDFIGEKGDIFIKDSFQESLRIKDLSLIRFVEYIPTIISPSEGEELVYPYSFKFKSEKPNYSSYLNLSIIDGNGVTIFTDSFSITDTLFIYNSSLKEGEYRFLVRVYDLFGNFSENSVTFFSK